MPNNRGAHRTRTVVKQLFHFFFETVRLQNPILQVLICAVRLPNPIPSCRGRYPDGHTGQLKNDLEAMLARQGKEGREATAQNL